MLTMEHNGTSCPSIGCLIAKLKSTGILCGFISVPCDSPKPSQQTQWLHWHKHTVTSWSEEGGPGSPLTTPQRCTQESSQPHRLSLICGLALDQVSPVRSSFFHPSPRLVLWCQTIVLLLYFLPSFMSSAKFLPTCSDYSSANISLGYFPCWNTLPANT